MDALENLDVWKKSCRLSVELYQALASCREWGFKDQITRSALSIPSNIAEGYERGNGRSRIQFLVVAKGSCGEFWTQLLIGRKAGFIDPETGKRLEKSAREIAKMLYGLIKHFENGQEQDVSRS